VGMGEACVTYTQTSRRMISLRRDVWLHETGLDLIVASLLCSEHWFCHFTNGTTDDISDFE
jgi:hypothetical protein